MDTFYFLFCLIVCVLLYIPQSNCLFLKLSPRKPICFIEDLEPNQQVVLHYDIPQFQTQHSKKFYDAFTGKGKKETEKKSIKVNYVIRDPNGNILKANSIVRKKGLFYFVAHENLDGSYECCLERQDEHDDTKDEEIEMTIRWELDEKVEELSEIQTKSKLSKFQEKMQIALHRIETLRHLHASSVEREKRFRMTTESTASRVFWYGFGCIFAVVISAIGQMKILRSHLRRKKYA